LKLVGRVPRARLESGEPVRLKYPPFDVVVMIVDGTPCALEDACNHAGASLAEGSIVPGGCIACPMHGYVFDARTGRLVAPRGLCADQRRFETTVEGDDIVVWDPAAVTITGI
jgi:nitrite reductase/ring-hydroxylating ferredoxin subunit